MNTVAFLKGYMHKEAGRLSKLVKSLERKPKKKPSLVKSPAVPEVDPDGNPHTP